MEEKILEFEINGFKYLYTAEINIDKAVKIKYISIKCKISNNIDKRYNTITTHEITSCLDGRCLNTVSGIEEFVNEIVQSMKISYDKNKFIKNLIKFIKENYLINLLDFNRLEDIFNRSLHKNKLSRVFDHSVFIPRVPNINFDTKVEIYPYIFNNKLYLHIKVSHIDLGKNGVFEYELTILSNGQPDYYHDAWDILLKIFNGGYVRPTVDCSIENIVEMIKYCFDEYLFNNIEQIEYFESDSKEE